MELYVLDLDPRRAASLLCDRDVLQGVVECAQLLCSAYRIHEELEYDEHRCRWQTTVGGREAYAPYAVDHPLAAWTAATYGNYAFVRCYLHGCLQEYQRRWGNASGKRHRTWAVLDHLREPPRRLRAAFLEDRDRMTAFRGPGGKPLCRSTDAVRKHRAEYAESRAGERYTGGTPDFMMASEFSTVRPLEHPNCRSSITPVNARREWFVGDWDVEDMMELDALYEHDTH